MHASHKTRVSLLVILATAGCGQIDLTDNAADEIGEGDGGTAEDTGLSTSAAEDSSGDSTDGPHDESGTGELAPCTLDCGEGGICISIDDLEYCECPEETEWGPHGCVPCALVDSEELDLALTMVSYAGTFTVQGQAPPTWEYDDANLWLENQQTRDRAWIGNTSDQNFSVRVTPGIYDIVYESETAGEVLPVNHRAVLDKIALFEDQADVVLDIPVATISGPILINGAAPPLDQYDDALISFRDLVLGEEIIAGNTRAGSYSINLVPGDYDVIYRVETPGAIAPHNDGARLTTVHADTRSQAINITAVQLQGEFSINAAPPPADEYDDATIELESADHGTVKLGNTHDGSYDVPVIPGSYDVIYRHETGSNVPQNQHASFMPLTVGVGPQNIDIPMVELSGALTLNGAPPPGDEYDDGIVHLQSIPAPDPIPNPREPNPPPITVAELDRVLLGNTHAGSYQVRLIPGNYAAYYAQETSGGTVPANKHALVLDNMAVAATDSVDLDIPTVTISGAFMLDGAPPPTSEYDNGRIYLRTPTGDAVLLGSTHEGGYSAIVMPGSYDVFYEQDTGGALVPSNLNAALGSVLINGPMNLDLDVPVVGITGQVVLGGGPAPMSASDGGQLYLRDLDGDSVLLGESFAPAYAATLVAGTYGVYYRSEASLTTPQNQNGRFACITVE